MPNALRPELTPLPDKMRHLPTDARGYTIPWFVDRLPDGTPEFRAMDTEKWSRAIRDHLCWVCGGKLGKHRVFVIGPMCSVNRVTSEPPCHLECAEWSAINCPFLSRPRMVRREDEEINEAAAVAGAAGVAITRNPGVALLWITHPGAYRLFKAGGGGTGHLFALDAPDGVAWYCEGRPATRDEVLASIDSGLPLLREIAEQQGPEAVALLESFHGNALQLLPVGMP